MLYEVITQMYLLNYTKDKWARDLIQKRKHRVNKGGGRYHPTVEAAIESLKFRKRRHVVFAQAELEVAKKVLEVLEAGGDLTVSEETGHIECGYVPAVDLFNWGF